MSTVVEIATPREFENPFAEMTPVRSLVKDILLEFIGTFTFVYISLAGVNQTVLSGSVDQLHIAICFALGLTSGVLIAEQSGAHLNPAVTFTSLITDPTFGFQRFVYYVIAQLLGGFAGGLLVIAVYYSWMNNYESADPFVGTFGTLKNTNNSLCSSILDQFVGSALLMFGIMRTPDSWSKPLTIGTILGALALFQGSNGFAFNLARDFGPRAASAIVFGKDVFASEEYWFWVPMVIPFIGIPFGYFMSRLIDTLN